jgi:hypothetical protein
MRRPTLLAALLIVAVVLASSAVAYAQQSDKTTSDKNAKPVTTENHSWNGYHWARESNPFTLKVGDNVSGAWEIPDDVLNTTITDWSQSDVVDLTKTKGGISGKKGGALRKCSPTRGQVEVCNHELGRNGWLGVATVWLSGSHITQGTVKLNDTYFNSSTYNTTPWRNLVSCQEVGHTLGLDHQDENFDNANLDTCMDYTKDPSTNQHPNSHDYEELGIIYNHTDTTTTVGANAASKHPGAMNRIDTSNPSAWGKLIQKKGRYETYEKDFGGGNKVRTWVIRADEKTSPENTSPGSAKQKAQ